MASVDLLAGTVMDSSASLLNDTAKTVYTYAAQVPYLRIAMNELQEKYQLNNIPVSQEVSTIIPVDAGFSQIVFNGVGIPTLPSDLIEPQQLWERNRGTDPFVPMRRRDYLPHVLEGTPVNMIGIFVWENQAIKFLPSNQNNDIKIDYIKELFAPVVDEFSIINVINAVTFLGYRTAGLCAEFIERNISSSNSLNTYAQMAVDRALGIGVKGKQSISTRRRPFRANFKRRG